MVIKIQLVATVEASQRSKETKVGGGRNVK